jgi:hypothetical protein
VGGALYWPAAPGSTAPVFTPSWLRGHPARLPPLSASPPLPLIPSGLLRHQAGEATSPGHAGRRSARPSGRQLAWQVRSWCWQRAVGWAGFERLARPATRSSPSVEGEWITSPQAGFDYLITPFPPIERPIRGTSLCRQAPGYDLFGEVPGTSRHDQAQAAALHARARLLRAWETHRILAGIAGGLASVGRRAVSADPVGRRAQSSAPPRSEG